MRVKRIAIPAPHILLQLPSQKPHIPVTPFQINHRVVDPLVFSPNHSITSPFFCIYVMFSEDVRRPIPCLLVKLIPFIHQSMSVRLPGGHTVHSCILSSFCPAHLAIGVSDITPCCETPFVLPACGMGGVFAHAIRTPAPPPCCRSPLDDCS